MRGIHRCNPLRYSRESFVYSTGVEHEVDNVYGAKEDMRLDLKRGMKAAARETKTEQKGVAEELKDTLKDVRDAVADFRDGHLEARNAPRVRETEDTWEFCISL